jgi:hypothetical protein
MYSSPAIASCDHCYVIIILHERTLFTHFVYQNSGHHCSHLERECINGAMPLTARPVKCAVAGVAVAPPARRKHVTAAHLQGLHLHLRQTAAKGSTCMAKRRNNDDLVTNQKRN